MRDFCMLAVLGAIGVVVGLYMGEGRTDERAAPAAASSYQAAEDAGYLPARVTNQAMDWLWSGGRLPIGMPVWVY